MSVKRINTIGALWLLAAFSFPGCTSKQTVSSRETNNAPYSLSPGLQSRSISFENPTGAAGLCWRILLERSLRLQEGGDNADT